MTLGHIGDCVVGALDANGNTIASCGYAPGQTYTTGQMLADAPTCMPGDSLSFVNGNWVCVAGAASSGLPSWLLPAGLLAVFAIAFMGKR